MSVTTNYKASRSRSQGRGGWCVLFNHPVAKTRQGKPLKVRRGLGTQDAAEADRLVAEMDRLLADRTMWSAAARASAVSSYSDPVVRAFFDPLESKVVDGWAAREEILAVPGPAEGYSRVLLLGATGAGKTTLLRQFIGSDPKRDRFPSISPAKTTVADTEIVLAPGPYDAVVSFISRDVARLYVEECVVRALAQAVEGRSDEKILADLLEHREQRFRLSYLLGKKSKVTEDEIDDDDAEDDDEGGEVEVTPTEHAEHVAFLDQTLASLKTLALALRTAMEQELGFSAASLAGNDRDAFLDLIEERAWQSEEVASIVEEVMDEITRRLAFAEGGEIEYEADGWPFRWTAKAQPEERAAFIRCINRFTSNYAPNFGKLLTPLVDGIRVRGPFKPIWTEGDEIPRLVLMDGEGLGHTNQSAASLPTSLTRAFSRADLILLADSAQQPMLAAPQAALRSISAMGHDRKLAIAFTHFDQVTGPNLDGLEARKDHVLYSLENALSSMEEGMRETIRGLRRNLEGRVFFLAKIQKSTDRLAPGPQRRAEAELVRLLTLCQDAIKPAEGAVAVPVYDMANFVISISKAMAAFQRSWDGRLGLRSRPGVAREHWTRVKALARRFAEFGIDAYDTMMPVADLHKDLAEGLADFISTPRRWEPANADAEARQRAVEVVRQKMAERVKEFAAGGLQVRPRIEWTHALGLSGTGSGTQRSREIWSIYEMAAPDISEVPTEQSAPIVDTLRVIFREAVKDAGGKVTD